MATVVWFSTDGCRLVVHVTEDGKTLLQERHIKDTIDLVESDPEDDSMEISQDLADTTASPKKASPVKEQKAAVKSPGKSATVEQLSPDVQWIVDWAKRTTPECRKALKVSWGMICLIKLQAFIEAMDAENFLVVAEKEKQIEVLKAHSPGWFSLVV